MHNLGSRLAPTILTELHGECMMHFSAIFITEVDGFYRDILGKSGAPPQSATSKASCWSLVTKLLRVLFKEIHKVRVEAAGLENIRDDVARVNGSFLYAALEELRVLREFHEHEYRQHPKFHHNLVMHLFECTRRARTGMDAIPSSSHGSRTLWLMKGPASTAWKRPSAQCIRVSASLPRGHAASVEGPAKGSRWQRGWILSNDRGLFTRGGVPCRAHLN